MTPLPNKVLIAEDDILLSFGLESLLKKMGCEIVAKCTTGRQLIEESLRHRPQLIIADIHLKDDISAIDAVSELQNGSHSFPVIYITADSDSRDREEASKRTGFIDYLIKPVDLEQLEKAIKATPSS